jgi:isocitrate lyase
MKNEGTAVTYQHKIDAARKLVRKQSDWSGIEAEAVARMQLQNPFQTGLDIARHTARIVRQDMAAYDADPAAYTQSLGCWHGFIGQQALISIKKHFGSTKGRYIYLSGWMVAALRSEFGPLPDQSMHEKTAVPKLIEELYTFLRQADARELGGLFRELDAAQANGDTSRERHLLHAIDTYESHVVPIIADIDAGFGNAEATYLLARKMIEAGASALQIENQVSDEKQCGHQDGKVTVPHEDFLAKIRACRYAFLELGVPDGIIVARTDSLGAGLTKQIAYSRTAGDLGDQYNGFLDCEDVTAATMRDGDVSFAVTGSRSGRGACRRTSFSFVPGRGRTGACSTASLRSRTERTFCGSRPRSPTWSRSPEWSIGSAKCVRTPSWSTTTRHPSTGRSISASRCSILGKKLAKMSHPTTAPR